MGRFVMSECESGHQRLSLFFTTMHAMPAQRTQSRCSKKDRTILPPQTSVNVAAPFVYSVLKSSPPSLNPFFTTMHAMPAQRTQSRCSKKDRTILTPQTSVNVAAPFVYFVLKNSPPSLTPFFYHNARHAGSKDSKQV